MVKLRSFEHPSQPPNYYYNNGTGFWNTGGYGWGGYGWNGYGWGGYGWGGYGWAPLFIGGFSCDPFNTGLLLMYGGPVCINPGAYWFGFDPFLFNFGLAPYFSASQFYGTPISPLYLGPNCLLCSSFALNPYASAMPNSLLYDPYMTPLESSSISISNGALPGLLPAPATSAPPLDTPAGGASSYTYATPSTARQPVTLVLTNGTIVQATQYRLAEDGQIHYVTTSGKAETIPFLQLDMKATMNANRDKGVDFLVPNPQQPKPQPKTKQ